MPSWAFRLNHAKGPQKGSQYSDDENSYGDSEHANSESPLLFIPMFQFIAQLVNGCNNLFKAFVHLFKALVHITRKSLRSLFKPSICSCMWSKRTSKYFDVGIMLATRTSKVLLSIVRPSSFFSSVILTTRFFILAASKGSLTSARGG